ALVVYMLLQSATSPRFAYTTLFRSIAGVPARPAAGRRGRGAPAVRGFAVPDAARPERDAADGVWRFGAGPFRGGAGGGDPAAGRSEEHTSELQSRENIVCRLLPEKK